MTAAEREVRAGLVRAQMILKIAPYIAPEVPTATRGKRFRIGVVGSDATALVIAQELPGKKVEQASVEVKPLAVKTAAAGSAAADFDLLYIAASVDEVMMAIIVAAHHDKPVVLVSERAGFIALGGGVQLFVKDGCVRFDVNVDVLKNQGLRPSPQLVKLARKGPCR